MGKIKSIELAGFRGARSGLRLDAGTRSVAVFGENACGKSSLTDAVEWFFTGRVGHLWREDCQTEALRNVNLADTEESSVTIDFDDLAAPTSKNLSPKLVARFNPVSAELDEYLQQASSERLYLRHHDLMGFVGMTKGDKRRYIAKVIGYEDVTSFRDSIQQALNALASTTQYVGAKTGIEKHRAELLRHCGEIVTTEAKYFEAINALLKPFEIAIEAATGEAVDASCAILKSRIKQEDKAARKLKFKILAEKLSELKAELATLQTHRVGFLPKYGALVENVAEVKKLHLSGFLKTGKTILENAADLDEACPFCEEPADLVTLQDRVRERIEELEATAADYQEVKTALAGLVSTINKVVRLCTEAHTQCDGSPCDATFVAEMLRLSVAAQAYVDDLPTKCNAFEAITEASGFVDSLDAVTKALDQQAKVVSDSEAKETLTNEEESIVETLTKMASIKEHFNGHQADAKVIEAFETQIRTLQKMFEEFVKVQTSAMQNALDLMSEDIGRFYSAMHPKENADGVHLAILGDEGVEFRYTFHGQVVYPPVKYLSESHLNSLGIALFLASVRLFNKRSKFFVLDDIVTSFDNGHRRRLLRILHDEFAAWQIIVLTHEFFWFELIRREMKDQAWVLRTVTWDEGNGASLEQAAPSLRAFIEEKRKKSPGEIENDLRKLLEQVLKEVCHSLEVKLSFRPNEYNEKRMPGEMISGLQGSLNKKCASLKAHAIFGRIDGSAFVANWGSHDNDDKLSAGDLEVVLNDIDELDSLFRCPSCSTVVTFRTYNSGAKTITCRCTKHILDWKE